MYPGAQPSLHPEWRGVPHQLHHQQSTLPALQQLAVMKGEHDTCTQHAIGVHKPAQDTAHATLCILRTQKSYKAAHAIKAHVMSIEVFYQLVAGNCFMYSYCTITPQPSRHISHHLLGYQRVYLLQLTLFLLCEIGHIGPVMECCLLSSEECCHCGLHNGQPFRQCGRSYCIFSTGVHKPPRHIAPWQASRVMLLSLLQLSSLCW